MSKTTLLYKDIAPGAALDATVTAPTAQDRSALAQLPSGTAVSYTHLTLPTTPYV